MICIKLDNGSVCLKSGSSSAGQEIIRISWNVIVGQSPPLGHILLQSNPGRRARRPGTIEQLKEAIRQEVVAIPPAMTRKAMDNFRERLQECVINNGRHLSDVIFKSVWKKCIIFFLYK